MKKIVLLIASALFLMPTLVGATTLLTENFDYETGNLFGKGASIDSTGLGWIHWGTNTEAPIQVVNSALSFEGYQTPAKGKAVALTSTNLGEDLQIAFTTADKSFTSGAVYAAMLVKVNSATGANTYFTGFTGKTNKGWVETVNATEYGRVFVMEGSDATKIKFGISKNNASPSTNVTEDLDIDKTYLIVLKYEFVAESSNDLATMWVNPATNLSAEPAAQLTATVSQGDVSTVNGIMGVLLRQGTTATKTMANITVDALRVATTWGDLFTGSETGGEEGEEGEEEETGTITVNPTTVLYTGYAGVPNAEQTIAIQATDITGDITITGSTHVSVTPTTISKEDALAGTTVTLNFTDNNNPTSNTTYTENLVFKAEGAKDVQLAVKCTVYASHDLMLPSNFYNDEVDVTGETAYRMTGKAIVYHTDGYKFYIENTLTHSGAVVEIYEALLSGVYQDIPEIGDEITNLCVFLEKSFGNVIAYSTAPYFYKKTAGGKTVNPYELTISEWGDPYASVQNYPNVLLKISNLNFGEAAGGRFTTDGIEVTDKTGTAKVKVFASSDLIGEEIPETADVVGISLSQSVLTLAPRGKNDILNAKYKTPTALQETTVSQSVRKQIVAGQLIIERDGKIFNILGTAL